jgi:serine/threonine-protein kinase
VQHQAIVTPTAYAERVNRAAMLYPWVDGSVLYHPTRTRYVSRDDPASPLHKFRQLPLDTIHGALETVFDAHLAVVDAGYVAIDFYDGSMIFDPATGVMRLVDLDDYRPGPFTVGSEPLSGSRRYFSPEETTPGATVDERTTVFRMGRTARLLLDAGDAEQAWRGNDDQLDVIAKATAADPTDRYQTLADFVAAWRKATATGTATATATAIQTGA